MDAPPLDPDPLSDYVAWAGHRNRDAILEELGRHVPTEEGKALEVATGSGMHISYFAPKFPAVSFLPSDKSETTFEAIDQKRTGIPNVRAPVVLDLLDASTFPTVEKFDVIFGINIFQVAPLSVADGMMRCAAGALAPGGCLMVYGPFKVDGKFSTDSNAQFDERLAVAGDPDWGLKDATDLDEAAITAGLVPKGRVPMPSNNFFLIYNLATP
ncbi:hypothetical protein CTAYLR_008992 [Chrysophaeum taylorii]|uniref:DUF938 domain-containing protein n=1 Tax=Chrysophaeum taylorii TaxID=2483200 RepID=A0AAD7XNW4_9STRA|nr:hypothetical protein CTAYLR_008992 [Chrysophaeum taylorii]